MTTLTQPLASPPPPRRIIAPLREIIMRQWAVAASRGLLQLLAGGLTLLLLVSLLLGSFGLPVVLRVIIAALAWAALLWIIAKTLRPVLRRWSLSRAAQQVEKLVPQLNERLSSAIELTTQEPNPNFRGSAELLDHLVRQAEEDAAAINPSAVVPLDSLLRWGLFCVPVITAWLVLSINGHTSQSILRGLYSTFLPWRSHLPAVLEKIQVQPGDVTLAQGDPLEIDARVSSTGIPSSSATLVRRFATGQTIGQPMDSSGPHDFHLNLDDLQQGFDYCVKTDAGSSDWFTATVHPRPAISRLDIHYDFPPYTGLGSRDDVGSAGTIDALVGTHVTLLIHTADAIVLQQSHLMMDENTPRQQSIALSQVGPADYKASFIVDHSGNYHLAISNEYGLAPKDDQLRAIVARFDQPPSVVIETPSGQVTVRPDDRVPIEYLASDDFGVQSLEGIVQVNDLDPKTIALKIRPDDRRSFKGTWTIDVPSILAAANVTEGSRISYQLKVTDNRDPDPQTALSARQTLIIDRNQWQSYADQLNSKRKRTLEEAIRRAITRLQDAENRNNRFLWFDENHFLSPQEQQDAHDLRNLLATTSKDLISAMRDFENTPFASVAHQATTIARTSIARSADDVARAEFAAADPPQRKYSATQAHQEIDDARKALEKLIESAQKAQQKFEAAEALDQAARKQDQAAREMALHPEQMEQARQTQQEAINKLNEAMQKNPALQDPRARELADALSDITKRIEQDQAQQTKLQNATSKIADADQAKDAAKAIAQEQKELNQKIADFSRDQKDSLTQANADVPHDDQQKQIVDNLEKGDLQPAGQAMKNASGQLRDAAKKFGEQARNANPNLSEKQRQQKEQDDKNTEESHAARDQAKQAAENLTREAGQPQPPPADSGGIQSAHQAADRIDKEADALAQKNDAGAKDADLSKAIASAKADADQAAKTAREAADAGDAKTAKKRLDAAAKMMNKAGQALAKAAETQAKADQKALAAANQQNAKGDADRAKDLARQQDAIAQRLGLQSKQLADANNGGVPPQQAAQEQRDLLHQTQQLREAAKQLAARASDAQQRWLGERAKAALPSIDQATAAQEHAADAEARNDPQHAADAQAEAQEALSKANAALRGNPLPPDQEAKKDSSHQPQAGQDSPADGGEGSDAQQAQNANSDGAMTPAQAAQQAAQAAQEAREAQQQAMQPNPAAAQEAASALARAAAAQRQASAGDEGSAQASAGQNSGAQGAGDADVGNGKQGLAQSGSSLNSSSGIRGQSTGGNNAPPAAVLDLGINASQWAKLPPLVRGELTTAAQQSGPPAYRQMIRDYYIRIAQMQDGSVGREAR